MTTTPGPAITLDDPTDLVGTDDPVLAAVLVERRAADPRSAGARGTYADRVRAFVGLGGAVAAATSLAAAIEHATAGRPAIHVPGEAGPLTAAALDAAITSDQRAALILEPRCPDADEAVRCAARLKGWRQAGLRIIADETRTAGRIARRTAWSGLGFDVDAVILGPSLAAGRRLWVVVQSEDGADRLDDVDVETLALASAVLERLVDEPIDEALDAVGEAVRGAFDAACRREDIRAAMVGPAALPHLRFVGQENAEGPLIAHHFGLELQALGVRAGADLAFAIRHVGVVPAIERAFVAAVARIRTLLIEHNSYLSGGLPWVFPDGHPRLRARGLARYRYPRLGAVDVDALPEIGAVRIAFAAGELGPITSSGFYLPTRVRGDFDVRVRYRVREWEAGPDSACLGLFVQNERSTARYYAQLMSTGDRPGERSIAAGLGGPLLGRRPWAGAEGLLRLTREGARVTAWHRGPEESEWTELGTLADASTDDVIVGTKIWSKIRCGGLVCDLDELNVDAEVPADQFPELEPRPDPRGQGR